MVRSRSSPDLLSNDLPAFGAPPVVEVAVSVQFSEIDDLDAARLGMAWQKYRQEFPNVEVQPRLGRALEHGGPPGPVKVKLQLGEVPPPIRMWFLSENGTRLLQVQQDCFAYNWRKLNTDIAYPHYDKVRDDFVRQLEKFMQFLGEEGLGDLEPDQAELTYVNHIPAINEQGGLSPLERHFCLWAGIPSEAQIPEPEMVSLQTQFAFRQGENLLGRLYVQLQSRFFTRDNSPVYHLQLIARGAPVAEQPGLQGVLEFLDQGHVWIVRSFADITTKEMHEIWQRQR